MIRILHIARYHHQTTERKLVLLTAEPDLEVYRIRPAAWKDEYGSSPLRPSTGLEPRTMCVPLLGQPNDPHRAIYRTFAFAMTTVRPDLIHVEEEPDSLAALQVAMARRLFAPNAKLVLHTWQNVNRVKRWYVLWVTRLALARADAVLCANQAAMRLLAEMRYRGLTTVLPPIGVDTQVFRPAAIRPANQAFTVLYAGRFVPEKGLDGLIEAVRQLRGVRLVLVGGGPLHGALAMQAQAAGLADRVEFQAPTPAEGMPAVLAQADVLALPSRSTPVWQEQFGRVLVEAMACRVPVIGSDSGAIPEVIGDAGLIFAEGDAGALASCISRLMTSSDLRAELADRGYHRVHAYYSQDVIAAQTAAFYRKMVS
jgi:L-malate glycosyltransferase